MVPTIIFRCGGRYLSGGGFGREGGREGGGSFFQECGDSLTVIGFIKDRQRFA